MPKQKASLKNIPKYEPGKPKKKHKSREFCLIFLIIFLIVVFLVIPSIVAATGIVKVPLLSRIFYHSEKPDINFSGKKNSEAISLKMESIQTKAIDGSAQAKISEEELNAYLNARISNGEAQMDFLKDVFILLHNNEIEIWASIEKSVIQTDVNLKATLSIKKGQPYIKLNKVKIGAISVPEKYLAEIEKRIDPELKKSFTENEDVTLQKIDIKEKVLIITGEMKESLKEGKL